MIRGKKNFLPPATLIMGFGFLFKLEDSSIERHRGERKVRGLEEESVASDVQSVTEEEVEINIEEGESEEESEKAEEEKLESIEEEKEASVIAEKEESGEVDDQDLSQDDDQEHGQDDDQEHGPESAASDTEQNEEEEVKEEDDDIISEFPDTDVKISLDRLGSLEIKVKTENENNESRKDYKSNWFG